MIHARTICLFLCYIFAIASISLSQDNDAEDYSYDDTSSNGPSNWGNINKDWIMCKDGVHQSPVDINSENLELVVSNKSLTMKSNVSEAILENHGHYIQVRWPNGVGHVTIDEKTFTIIIVHWHFPSEHTFNGTRFPLERHMILQGSDNQIAIVATVFQTGQPDNFLSPKMMTNIQRLANSSTVINLGEVAPPIVKSDSPYYKYFGSITEPPCFEGITWIIPKEIKTISNRQLELLHSALQYRSNSRPIQALNDRRISAFT